jgi:signal transduction histidine kinase
MMVSIRGWFAGGLFGSRYVGRLDALLAVVLGAAGGGLASGLIHSTHRHGGAVAVLLVLLMTLPVAIRSSVPMLAVATIATAAIIKDAATAPLVTCGAALPALALIVFSVGSRLDRRLAFLGAGLGVTAIVFQSFCDPQLKGFGIGGSIFVVVLWIGGRLVHSRDAVLGRLRSQTDELRVQRDRTAKLAVAADRARIADGLDGMLSGRIGTLADEAATGRASLATDPHAADRSLSAIEQEGRRALTEMRKIVGALRVEAPTSPEPSLDDIPPLLERLLGTQARLVITGDRRRLPAGLELSGYRIVERLLEPLEGIPGAQV